MYRFVVGEKNIVILGEVGIQSDVE